MRVILLGYGNIGHHHLRIMANRNDIEICAVIDLSLPLLGETPVFASLQEYLLQTDPAMRAQAAVVATPISTHFDLGMQLMQLGLHVFIEKPLAPTFLEAQQLCDFAQDHGLVLAVGHSERFNPAFKVFLNQFHQGITGQVYRIECNRTGPFPQRVSDAGATIDLAVHDLDSLNWVLDNQEPQWIFARTEQRIHPHHDDGLNAMLGYHPDIIVQLTVNWLSPRKNRILDVYGHLGMLRCDFFLKQVTFFENLYNRSHPDEYGIGGIEVGPETAFPVSDFEPLAHEHDDFWLRVNNGASDLVALQSACLAVKNSNRCHESARSGVALHRGIHD